MAFRKDLQDRVTFLNDLNNLSIKASDRIYRQEHMNSQVMAYLNMVCDPVLKSDGTFHMWFGHWVRDEPLWNNYYNKVVKIFETEGFIVPLSNGKWKRLKDIDYGTMVEECKAKWLNRSI